MLYDDITLLRATPLAFAYAADATLTPQDIDAAVATLVADASAAGSRTAPQQQCNNNALFIIFWPLRLRASVRGYNKARTPSLRYTQPLR